MRIARCIAGLGLVSALIAAGYWAFKNYAALIAVSGPLRPYLADFRIPILAILGFLALSVVSWAWGRIGLGR